uniref:Serine/threonine-protein kinase n=1 Tax=Strongyloides papillosus TaxID=174720 RepID=A0A0N5BRL0_STREA
MDFKIPINDVSAEDNWVFKSSSWDAEDRYTYSIPQKYPPKPAVDIKRLHSINKLNDRIKRHASLKQEISTISSTMFFGNEENNKTDNIQPNNTLYLKSKNKSHNDIMLFPHHSEESIKPFHQKNEVNLDLRHSSSSESDDSLSEIYLQRHYPIQKNFSTNDGYKERNYIRRHKTLDNVHLQKNNYNFVGRPTYTKARRSQSYHYPRQYQSLTINTDNLECDEYSMRRSQPKMLRRDSLYYDICDICFKTHKSNEKCSGYFSSPLTNEQPLNKPYLSQDGERTFSNYNNLYFSNNPYIKPLRSRSPQILKPDTLYYNKYNNNTTTTNSNNNNNQAQNFLNLLENNDVYRGLDRDDDVVRGKKSQSFQVKESTVIRPANAGPAWKLKATNANEIPRHPSPVFRYGTAPLPKSLYDYDFYANEMKKKAQEKRTRTIIAVVVCLIAFIIVICAGIVLASTYK